jgi:hypothetical protein
MKKCIHTPANEVMGGILFYTRPSVRRAVRHANYRENRWDYFTEICCEDTYAQYPRMFFSFSRFDLFSGLQAAIFKIRLRLQPVYFLSAL